MGHALGVKCKSSMLGHGFQSFSCFSTGFVFKSVIHFELTFVLGVRFKWKFVCLYIYTHGVQTAQVSVSKGCVYSTESPSNIS